MSVQWYPGHMYKAGKEMKEALPSVDLIIEVLDARIPASSENPLIAEYRGDKPAIKILNKSDLADPALTETWQRYYEAQKNVKTLALSSDQPARIQHITDLCRKLLPEKFAQDKLVTCMIMGIPNVGKSTLINILTGRTIAKTGNEPAVTKRQQRIKLEDNVVLLDTPGILWPKFENQHSGYRLAVTGAIKDTAIEYEDVAFYAAEYLLQHCPEKLKARYQYDGSPTTELELLEALGRKRGCMGGGGLVDLHKASVILINEYRDGTLGRITLETPEMIEQEWVEVARIKAEKEARERLRKENSSQKRKKKR